MGTQGTDLEAVLLSIAASLEKDWYDWEEDRDPNLEFEGWAAKRIGDIVKAFTILLTALRERRR